MSLLIFPPLILIAAIAERPRRYPAYRKRANHFETTKKRLPILHIDKRR